MIEVVLTCVEGDGAAWFSNGKIFINVRWLNTEEEAPWYIDESFIHEYVEHVLGLGHESAVYVENVLRKYLYSTWYRANPSLILYGGSRQAGDEVSECV